jgi:hypothetical protein
MTDAASWDDTEAFLTPNHGTSGDFDEYADPDADPSENRELFAGDESGLDYETRRALIFLLQKRLVTGRSNPREYKALVEGAHLIRKRLNDLLLVLELDTQREVAFKRQALTPGGLPYSPTLLKQTTWPREDTILLTHLRTLARSAANAGRDVQHVDRQELLDHVVTLRPPTATNQAGDNAKADKAIERLRAAGVLLGAEGAREYDLDVRAIEALVDLPTLKKLLIQITPLPEEPDTEIGPEV